MRRSTVLLIAVVLAVGVAASCSKTRNDQAIVTDLQAKMFADPQLKTANLSVTSKNGEVTLSGEVPSDGARYEAFKLASGMPGVTKVNDLMTVQTAEASPAPEPAPPPEPTPPKPQRRKLAKRAATAPVQPLSNVAPTSSAPASQAPVENATAPAPLQPKHVEIPAGTPVTVRMIDSVDSQINHVGEVFHASLDAPLVVDNEVVVPAGNDVYVKLVQARSAGRLAGRSELGLELVRMQFQGKSYPLLSNEYEQVGSSRGKRTAETIGAGAAIGAAIGAIAGGGKGAAIGAGVGAGSGTAIQVVTKGKQVRIPSETKLEFKLEQPVEVSYFPGKNRSRE